MQRCESCGAEAQLNARFCGNCGRLLPDISLPANDITLLPAADIPAPTTPPLFSSPSYPPLIDPGMESQDANSTLQSSWSGEGIGSVNQEFPDPNTDENETLFSDLLLPGMPTMQGQMPPSAQAPMVQGTPQVGGVPSVQGTPPAPGSAPPSTPNLAHGAGSSAPSPAPAPSQTPSWEPQAPPSHYQPLQHPQPEPPPHYYQPVHHPQPTPPPTEPEYQLHHHHHSGPLQARTHTSLHHSSATVATSKARVGVASKWLIVALAAVVVLATSGLILAHALMPALPPGLTFTGTSVVAGGGILHVRGQGFIPGGTVTFTIDNGLPVSLAGQHGTQDSVQRTERSANVPGLSQMFIAGEFLSRSAADSSIAVSSSGTFDADVTVPLSLSAGVHTIHATENQGSQSASLKFTIPSPKLAVNPNALNFGSIEVGRAVKLSVTVSNRGEARLNWSATVEGSNTNWLTLQNGAGVIEANGSDKTITVTANTNGLSMGHHSATLHIHSDYGDVPVSVNLNVISPAQSAQQAHLNVPQQNLDFGQLQAGQHAQQIISIADLGNLPLKWQASLGAASASWLTMTTTSGTVQVGAAPQPVQVTVNTTGMAAGSYNGTINITSNGGSASVGITLVVTAVTPTPTPTTPMPTSTLPSSPTTLPTPPSVTPTTPSVTPTTQPTSVPTADPSSFTVTQESFFFSATAGQRSVQTQKITLTNASQSGIINWSVSIKTDNGGGWLSVPPGKDTLQPNTSKDYQITVTVSKDMPAGTYNGTVTFSPNSAKNVVTVTLTVNPAPTPCKASWRGAGWPRLSPSPCRRRRRMSKQT